MHWSKNSGLRRVTRPPDIPPARPAHTRNVDEGESGPAQVPGPAEETGATGLYGDLPPGVGPLLEVATECLARAFDAYARDDQDLCDALLAEGEGAAGGMFTGLVERVVSPAYPYRVDSPYWDPFLVYLAFAVLELRPEPSAPPTY
jgi:hypothetical protein